MLASLLEEWVSWLDGVWLALIFIEGIKIFLILYLRLKSLDGQRGEAPQIVCVCVCVRTQVEEKTKPKLLQADHWYLLEDCMQI